MVDDEKTLAWMKERFDSLDRKVDGLERKVDEVREIAEGNEELLRGHNSVPGIVAEVNALSKDVDRIQKGQANCPVNELQEAFVGTHDRPGLFERVRTMENFNKNLKYWFVLLAGTIVVGIINAIIQIAMAASH